MKQRSLVIAEQKGEIQKVAPELKVDIETAATRLPIAESSYWTLFFCRVADYQSSLRNPADWLSSAVSVLTGTNQRLRVFATY